MSIPRQAFVISVVLACLGMLPLQPVMQAKAIDAEQLFTDMQRLGQSMRAANRARRRKATTTRQLANGDVFLLQRSLNSLGYNTGEPDGKFGRRTEQALASFLRNKGHNPRTFPKLIWTSKTTGPRKKSQPENSIDEQY